MIRIQSNSSVVKPNMANPRITNNNVDLQVEAQSKGKFGQVLGNLKDTYIKLEKEEDTNRRLEAQNEYDRRITELKHDIESNRRLGNAKGTAAYFKSESAKIRQEVYGKSGIKYQDTADLFHIQTERSNISDLDSVQKFEVSETDKNHEIQLDNMIAETTKKGIQNGNVGDLALARDTMFENIEIQGRRFGEDYINAKKMQAASQLAKAAIENKMAINDTEGVLEILNKFKDDIDDREFTKITAMLGEVQQNNFVSETVRGLIGQKGKGLTPDQIDKELDGKEIPYTVRGAADYPDLPRQVGIDWESVDKDHQQATKYVGKSISEQLGLNSTISSGYRDPKRNAEAGGVEGSAHTLGTAIDLVFDRELTQEEARKVEQIGREAGFKLAWYHDAGSGNHLHLDTLDPDKAKNYQGAQTKYRKLSNADKAAVKAEYYKTVNLEDAVERKNKSKFYEDQQNSFLVRFDAFMETNPSAESIQSFYDQEKNNITRITQGDFDGRKTMMGMLDSAINSVAKQEELTPQAEDSLMGRVASGEWQTKGELNAFMTKLGLPFGTQRKMLDQFNKTGSADVKSYDWNTIKLGAAAAVGWSDNQIKATENQHMLNSAVKMSQEFVESYKKEKGVLPTQLEVQDNMRKTLTPQTFVGGNTNWLQRIGGYYEYDFTPAELNAAGIVGQPEIVESDEEGNRTRDLFLVTFEDGSTATVRGDRLEAFVKRGEKLER